MREHRSICRLFWILACGFSLAHVVPAQLGSPAGAQVANLPAQPIGPNDLIDVWVYDAPELTGTIRVSVDGLIRLPMLKQRIKVQDLMPGDLESVVAKALHDEHLLVNPVVKVTLTEYGSHPISVAGAVNQPITFQASAPTTLLEAITRAGGLAHEAGPEILVTHMQAGAPEVQRVLVKDMMDANYPALNIMLKGGEQVRVPEKARVYVMGSVKLPGMYQIDDTESSVLKALALSQGLIPYAGKEAYIYRQDDSGNKNEIIVPLTKILERKAADSPLLANDILYVPDNKGRRMTLGALEKLLLLGSGAGAAAVYTLR